MIDDVFDPNVVYHMPQGGAIHGVQGVKGLVASLRAGFPDLQVTIEELVAENDTLVARVAPSGTNTGAFMGNPPTGKRVDWSVVHISHFNHGKIVDNRPIFDQLTFLQRLGLAPTP